MKKIFAIWVLLLGILAGILNAQVITETTTKTSRGEGEGLSRQEAINNAIIEALGKLNGIRIESIKQNFVTSELSNEKSELQDIYSAALSKVTKGRVDSYEINHISQDTNGKYTADVTIYKTTTKKSYKAPGISHKSRRSISVFDTSSSAYSGVGSILQQHLITNLLESRKFNVLDRDSKGYYDLEKALIKSPDAQSDEIYKLGNVLGSDYFLLFGIQGIAGQTKKSNLTNKEIHQVEIVVDYRVILFATRQIKYSNTLTVSLNLKDDNLSTNQEALKQVAQKISDDILNAIYPLKVANITNNEAVFSQTLKVGDVYECFALGEAIKDSYTKETTGRIETKVGEVTITRTNPKMSYGSITQGSVQKGNLCRPLGGSNGGGEGRDANYSINPSGGVNLGF